MTKLPQVRDPLAIPIPSLLDALLNMGASDEVMFEFGFMKVWTIDAQQVFWIKMAYSGKNREKKRAYDKVYREKNREKKRAYEKAYYEKNREKISAYNKVYREKNREKISAQRKAQYHAKKKEGKL